MLLLLITSCNISERVYDKFVSIDQDLTQQIDSLVKVNASLPALITTDSVSLAAAQEIRKQTTQLLTYLDRYRAQLKASCAQADNPQSMVDYTCQELFSLGENQDGQAYVLEQKMNHYIKRVNTLVVGKQFDQLAKPASKIPAFKNDPKNKEKDFATLNFNHTPLVATYAILSQFKQEVLQVENQALIHLTKKQ